MWNRTKTELQKLENFEDIGVKNKNSRSGSFILQLQYIYSILLYQKIILHIEYEFLTFFM